MYNVNEEVCMWVLITAIYFVRTTLFSTDKKVVKFIEYSTKYRVRSYALLEDGAYVHSNVSSYTVFNIAG